MTVLLDTNILLDVLLKRPGLLEDSKAVLLRCEALRARMFIAWHGLATAYYFVRKGRTEAEAMIEVDKILAWTKVADASDTSARHARTLGFADFEDALQAAAAEACLADVIVTRNTRDFSNSKVLAITPQDFLISFPWSA